MGGGGCCGLSQWVQLFTRAQINFEAGSLYPTLFTCTTLLWMQALLTWNNLLKQVPHPWKFIDPVFAKTSPERSFQWLKTSVLSLFSRKLGSRIRALDNLLLALLNPDNLRVWWKLLYCTLEICWSKFSEPPDQRKFIDWKKTKLFRFRWNWADDQNLRGIRLQISSSPPPTCRLLVYSGQWRSFTPLEGVVRIL